MTYQFGAIAHFHTPPFRIGIAKAYKPGAFPSEVMGYQVVLLDNMGRIALHLLDGTILPEDQAEHYVSKKTWTKTATAPGGDLLIDFVQWIDERIREAKTE